jgi:hypothetical protein
VHDSVEHAQWSAMSTRHSSLRVSLAATAFGLAGLAASAAPLAAQAVAGPTSAPAEPRVLQVIGAELAGRSLAAFPHFQRTRVFHATTAVQMAVDPSQLPQLAGVSADVYVVAAKDVAAWGADRSLVDVRAGGPQTVLFSGLGIQANTLVLDAGTLSGDAGIGLGVGYDVVIDVDLDGKLGARDVIDGYGDEAGFYVVRDTTSPGPLTPVEILYTGGTWLGQNTFYPAEIATLGQVPLVVVSHGNGHNYQWYDHIGKHLASYGYIVMSHENNTGPGSDTASLTTLTNTDYFLANLGTIAGGALNGHVDSSRILWIGHSRGGEGVVRAYSRLLLGVYTSPYFDEDDVRMVMSLAPVTHIDSSLSFPADVPYVLMYGSSDADVSGSPSASASKPFAFYERAFGYKHDFYLQGAGHAYFHNSLTGSCVCTGPATLTKSAVHAYELGYLLPLVQRYAEGNVAALDFFERMDGDLRPFGVPAGVIASKEYREPVALAHFVVDDFQSNPGLFQSSSGGAVSTNVMNASEGLMRDQDGSFDFSAGVPLNGMTRYDDGGDDGNALVFDWTSPGTYFLEFAIVPAERDLSDDAYLSLRACQGTRHPQTDLLNGPLEFTVTLRDTNAVTSSVRTGLYGDVTRTYQRTGSGIGAGWANEFSTVRLRLADFLTDGTGLDLSSIEAIRLEFGAGLGSVRGRLGIDDVEIVGR